MAQCQAEKDFWKACGKSMTEDYAVFTLRQWMTLAITTDPTIPYSQSLDDAYAAEFARIDVGESESHLRCIWALAEYHRMAITFSSSGKYTYLDKMEEDMHREIAECLATEAVLNIPEPDDDQK